MPLAINSAFDGGNISVVSASSPDQIRLNIRKDHMSDYYQWFYYRVSGAKDTPCRMVIENAGGSAYPAGWPGYQACASYDRETWFRVPTAYENGELVITHTPHYDLIYYAYFAPYTMERHQDMIADFMQCDGVSYRALGQSLEGQPIDCLHIGEGEKTVWVIARQHPGETMAEWWMEGFLTRLCDPDDPVARRLKSLAQFYIVPNMNPDGSRRGHLRTNAVGVNLNREWDMPSLEKSPEVFQVLAAMDKTGIDLALDVHGDESLPYNFIAGSEGMPGFSVADEARLKRYKETLMKASPDFQIRHGYPRNAPGKANKAIAGNALYGRFGCLSMTLEMPFKDNADLPDPLFGWSPRRCQHLGAANLDAMLADLG